MKKKNTPPKPTKKPLPLRDQVQVALTWLEKKSNQRDRENLTRFAISTNKFFGVSMSNMSAQMDRCCRDFDNWAERRKSLEIVVSNVLALVGDQDANLPSEKQDTGLISFL